MEWIALIAWLLTAVGGFVLLSIWVARGGMQAAREPGSRIRPALILSHFAAGCDRARALDHLRGDRLRRAGVDRVRDPLVVAVLGWTMFAIWWRRRQGAAVSAGRRPRHACGAALPGGGRRGTRSPRGDDGRARVPGGDRRGRLNADVRTASAGGPFTLRSRRSCGSRSGTSVSVAASSSSCVHHRRPRRARRRDRPAGPARAGRSRRARCAQRWRWIVPRHAKVCSRVQSSGPEREVVQPELLGELSTERRLDVFSLVDAASGRRSTTPVPRRRGTGRAVCGVSRRARAPGPAIALDGLEPVSERARNQRSRSA